MCSHRITSLLTFCVTLCSVYSFNLSPYPNIILRRPEVDSTWRSSYFGYTINLRNQSILIGAPRANSTHPNHLNITEPGVIYRCRLDTPATATACEQFDFETAGNIPPDPSNKTAFVGEQRDHQWLGASMDGGPADTDRLVVCAPRIHSLEHRARGDIDLVAGICYLTSGTGQNQPQNVTKIQLMTQQPDYMRTTLRNFLYSFDQVHAQQGMSVYMADNRHDIVIGSPGLFNARGTVTQYPDAAVVRNSWLEPKSLFGYAVASGHFHGPGRSEYLVASAPQAAGQLGQVYVFKIIKKTSGSQGGDSHKIASDRRFYNASQMGEFFGYALVADDFNGDNWTDLVVAAPFHRRRNGGRDGHDNGAVYVYTNARGQLQQPAVLLTSPYDGDGGRFGMAVSRLGDLNRDGFNDLAVGAPYEDDGAGRVYVFLGSSSGLEQKHSQMLRAMATTPGAFGLGLSRGVDTDGNGFGDLAVGAPFDDRVYVHLAYPIVELHASIVPAVGQIGSAEPTLEFKVCWWLMAAQVLRHNVGVWFEIRMDKRFGRLRTQDQQLESISFDEEAAADERCRKHTVLFHGNIVSDPISLEMSYGVRKSSLMPTEDAAVVRETDGTVKLCETCVAVKDNRARNAIAFVVLSDGCKETKCVADLRVNGTVIDPRSSKILLGHTTSMAINFTIDNVGDEKAILPMLNITTTARVSFVTLPSECRLQPAPATNVNKTLLCDLSVGSGDQALIARNATTMRVQLDTSKLRAVDGGSIIVHALVTSASKEANYADNEFVVRFTVDEQSAIEVTGNSSRKFESLESMSAKELGVINVEYSMEVRNFGPSDMDKALVEVLVPLKFRGIPIVAEWKNSLLTCEYNGDFILSETSSQNDALDASETTAFTDSTSKDTSTPTDHLSKRAQNITESLRGELSDLPPKRTVLFNCDHADAECERVMFMVPNLRADGMSTPVILLNLSLDLTKISNFIDDVHDFFVLQPLVRIQRDGDASGATVSGEFTYPFTAVSKYAQDSVPLWVLILSALGGVLLLAVITYTMQRSGFFRREHKTKLIQLKRRTLAMSMRIDEAALEAMLAKATPPAVP